MKSFKGQDYQFPHDLSNEPYVLKLICEACTYSSIPDCVISLGHLDAHGVAGRHNCIAEMISKNSTITRLEIANSYFTTDEALLIGEAIKKNTSLEILDLYTYRSTCEGVFGALCNGISQSTSLKIAVLPSMRNYLGEDIFDHVQYINKLISNQSLCRLQVLDIIGLVSQELVDVEKFRRIFIELENNTSIHTIIVSMDSEAKKVMLTIFELMDELLTKNFTLQSIINLEEEDHLKDEAENIVIANIQGKLKKNKSLFLMKKSMNNFLLLRLILNHYFDSKSEYFFPRDIVNYILNFLFELQLSECGDEYFRSAACAQLYPLTHSLIYS